MTESIFVSTVLPATPEQIYTAWLDSEQHSAFTGGNTAEIDPAEGGTFTAWDGYISGKNLTLEPFKRILQLWRTTDFPEGADNSCIEVSFEETVGGTKISIKHDLIPEGQGESYRQGWIDFYFEPMKEYFGKK